MSNPTSNFNWQMPTATDLVTDLPADFEVFGQAVDTSLADLRGGTTGQILAKNSATDMDFIWTTAAPGDITGVTAGTGISGGGTSGDVTVTNSMATAIDAKGDLIVGTGADTFARLAVGATNGHVLTVDSAEATGLKYSAIAAAGSNWSLVSSAALTGAGTITISGISGADQILVGIASASGTVSGSNLSIRFNSDSGANYNAFQVDNTNFASYNTGMLSSDSLLSQTQIYLANMSNSAGSNMSGYLYLSGCNAAGLKAFHAAVGGKADGSNSQGQRFTGGYYNSASTISSVTLVIDSGSTFDNGTMYVYKTA